MSRYSNRGGNVTKPYISGANYILKMSDYSKGDWLTYGKGCSGVFSTNKNSFRIKPQIKVPLGMLIKIWSTIQPKMGFAENRPFK